MAFSRITYTANSTFTPPAGVTSIKVWGNQSIKKVNAQYGQMSFLDSQNNMWAGTAGTTAPCMGVNVANAVSSSPVQVVGGLKFAGPMQGLFSSGNTWFWIDIAGNMWGSGAQGAGGLGNNTNTGTISSPVKVLGGIKFSQFPNILGAGAVAGNSAMALDGNGNAWGWGLNQNGVLGNNAVTAVSSPVQVVGGIKFISLAWGYDGSGNTYTANGVDTSGNIWTWGSNKYGQAGNNVSPVTTNQYSSPVQVVGGIKFAQSFLVTGPSNGAAQCIAAGVDTSGNMWFWGAASAIGLYGNGVFSSPSVSSPVQVIGGIKFAGGPNQIAFTGITISGTASYGCLAIDTSGNLWAWGSNLNGQLGTGNVTSQSSPVLVAGGLKWQAIYGGLNSTFGVDTSGNMWAWGANAFGQLGIGSITYQSSPVKVVGGLIFAANQISIDPAYNNIYAADLNGTVWAWGANGLTGGALQIGVITPVSSPVQVVQGLTFPGPNLNPNESQPVQSIGVTPGQSYPITVQTLFCTFNNIVLGQFCQSVTVEFEQ